MQTPSDNSNTRVSKYLSRALLPLLLVAAALPAAAQLQLPEGDVQRLVRTSCVGCHNLSNIVDASKTRAQWEFTINRMQGMGASLPADRVDAVVDYLTQHFGPQAAGTSEAAATTAQPPAPVSEVSGGRASAFTPVTDAVLSDPPAGSWLRWRGHGARAHSPLTQLTPANVDDLRLAWSWAMEPGETEQEPLVYQGILYLPHPSGVVQALDARNGEMLWEYRRSLPQSAVGDSTRGLALYGDKLYLTTPDGYLVALDARSGETRWEVSMGDMDDRVSYSSSPIAAEGRVFAGQTCGTGTSQACALAAFDADTGELLWERESVAGADDPAEHQATWGQVPYEMRRKASFWLTGSYDPELDLLYWTTASAYPYPEILKGNTEGGALLYTNSILALDPASGEIEWYFQMQPRDNFDMDHQDNPILADVSIGGETRKLVYVLGKPGILWAFDRTDGEYLWHRQLVSDQNLYAAIDSDSGEITMNESLIPREIGERHEVCPGMRGGKLFQTNAFSPDTGAVYSPVSNSCAIYEVVPVEQNNAGVDYSELRHMQGSNQQVGRLMAVSGATGEELWTWDQRAALGSVLTTGGGLVFVGDLHRWFRALDARSGDVVWEMPLSAPVTGYPISYAVDDQQYVAVAVGGSTSGTRHLGTLYPELKTPHGSNLLMVFKLGD